jgi:hypothetical protein
MVDILLYKEVILMGAILSTQIVSGIPGGSDVEFGPVNIGVTIVPDTVLFGRVVLCGTETGIVGAIVKVFDVNNNPIVHTYSGDDGYYMVNIPANIGAVIIRVSIAMPAPTPCS